MTRRGAHVRLTEEQLNSRLNPYGYYLTEDTVYKNRTTPFKVYDAQEDKTVFLSMNQIDYRINKKHRPLETSLNSLLSFPTQSVVNPATKIQNRIQKFTEATVPNTVSIRDSYIKLVQKLAKGKQFTIDFKEFAAPDNLKLPIVLAAMDRERQSTDDTMVVRVEYRDSDKPTFFHASPSSFSTFISIVNANQKTPNETAESDSINEIFEKTREILKMTISFKKSDREGAFYPYINKHPTIDLSEWGIYRSFSVDNYKDNCFIEALKYSGQFTEDEINFARFTIRMRMLRLQDFKELCEALHFTLIIRYQPNDKVSRRLINPGFRGATPLREVSMWLYNKHYFIDRKGLKDPITNKPVNVIDYIKSLHNNGFLAPIPEKDQLKIWMNYDNQLIATNYNDERLIKINDKNAKVEARRHKFRLNNAHTSTLFGCECDKNSLNNLYNELQKAIDTLGIRVNVTHYKYFTELMQKIMYEYGCFEGVYEVTEPLANQIKSQFVYPTPHTKDHKPFYSNDTLYYIDLNGAYMSVIDGIPTGEHFDGPLNKRIGDLIKKLYLLRKQTRNPIIARTIKIMMTSCWGYSMRKAHTTTVHRPDDINKFIEDNLRYVVSYNDRYVELINPTVIHYSYPQFAKRVLDNYHKKMNEIRSLCNVLYENIDAVLISESDYNKLLSMGYIGNKLGQFKIEHVFKEIAIKSSRCIMGIETNGDIFRRSTKIETMNEFLQTML